MGWRSQYNKVMNASLKKIAIVGPGGSGKSHLANRIGGLLGIQVFHLDALLYKSGWQAIPLHDQEEMVLGLVHRSAWVIDGEHLPTQKLRFARADAIIFLDFSLLTRLRQLWRRGRLKGSERVDLAPGCDPGLSLFALKWALFYSLLHRKKTMRNLVGLMPPSKVHVFRCRREVDQFVDQIEEQLNSNVYQGR